MKKLIALTLAVVALLCCLVGCSSKWTDEDITKAHTVEITKYNNDDEITLQDCNGTQGKGKTIKEALADLNNKTGKNYTEDDINQ